MHRLLVSSLLVSAVAVPLVLSKKLSPDERYERFKKQHTYSGTSLMDCTKHMNEILKGLTYCKEKNTFILGDDTFRTDLNAVNQICTGDGVLKVKFEKSEMKDDLYESKNRFRVVLCERDDKRSGAQPPHCVYGEVKENDTTVTKITVACNEDTKKPVHFEPPKK